MSAKKERKCIGVIIAKPNKEYQTSILKGIYRAAFENDMNVAVFASTIAGGLDATNAGELDIFSLPNYDRLTGVVYLPDTFDFDQTDELITKPILDAVNERNFPAVTIDYKIDGIPNVSCDDTDAVRAALEHIINDHGCKDIAYMTGFKGHPHAERRLQIYYRAMEEHGLSVLPGRVHYGDFWYDESENFVKSLIDSENGMPEAIVCANNHMACGVYKALRKYGFKVPKDIIVADYSDEAEVLDFISGSIKSVEEAGYTAGLLLIDIINGKKDIADNTQARCGFTLNRSITCGCKEMSDYDYSKVTGVNIDEKGNYFSEFNQMSTDLLGRQGYKEMFWGMDYYTFFIEGARGIYFCLCKDWNRPDYEIDREADNRYTEDMQLYYCRENHTDGTFFSKFENEKYFPVKEMFPKIFCAEGEPAAYIFRPLHFSDKNYGYIVLDYGKTMKNYGVFFDFWIKDTVNAMEAQRRLQNAKYLYIYDVMTKLYSRNGYNIVMPEFMERARNEGKQFFIALCDLNGLKYINDNFGHSAGDDSIKTAAEILLDIPMGGAETEMNFRIGGDEFVKAAIGNFSESDVAAFRKEIHRHFQDFNLLSGKPYPIYMSVGICIKNPDDSYTLDSAMTEADKSMFADKAKIKEETGFNPLRKEE